MIPQTPEQKIDCYQQAIDLLLKKKNKESDALKYVGMCILLRDFICKERWLTGLSYEEFVMLHFPELYSLKPPDYTILDSSGLWYDFEDIDSRIKCLNEAIDIVKEKNSNLKPEDVLG